MKPIIIAIDGVDYSGKSTMVSRLKEHYISEGCNVEVVNFPTKDGHGALARLALVEHRVEDCAQHMLLNMQEVLENLSVLPGPNVIIYDRFTVSTCANQGLQRGLDYSTQIGLLAHTFGPDIYYVLTLPHSTALARAEYRAEQTGLDWDDGYTACHLHTEDMWVALNRRYVDCVPLLSQRMRAEFKVACTGNDKQADEVFCQIRSDVNNFVARRLHTEGNV